MIYYIVISILFILLIISFSFYIKVKKEKNSIIENKNKKIREEWERENQILKKKYDELNSELGAKLNEVNTAINQHYISLKEEKEEQLKSDIEKEKSILNLRMQRELDQERASRLEEIKDTLEACTQFNNQRIEELNARTQWYEEQSARAAEEYNKILDVLEDYKKRRDAINEINRREEELQNEIDTHRIIISDNSKDDIKYLLSIENNIHNKDLLHKLIWSEYLQKPFNIMLNNIFGSKIPKNVIYCIENYSTHKKYIGKTSAEVSKRWTEHIKTSLNIGGVKRQKIHDAIFQNWDEFTFSIIEIVDENKSLSEREKYWINFYSTDKYGYNIKSGG